MPQAVPLSQAIDEYLAWLELDRHASPRTVEAYGDDLARFAAFAGGDEGISTIADLDRDVLRAYQRHLASSEGRAKPLAVSTRARRLVALRSFLRFAAREEWLPGDLGSTIDVPKLPERLPKPLEDHQRERLLGGLGSATLAEKRDKALVLFLLSTGCRISEALRLDREDWRRERVTVRGKGDRERVVVVTERARLSMNDYLGERRDPSPALFVSFHPASRGAKDNRLTTQGAGHVCRRIAAELGLDRFHPHQLRHTLGTVLQETMGDARLTAETLGHRGLASVSGYTKITDRRRREAYKEMQRAGF